VDPPAHELTLIEPGRNGVTGLTRPWLPRRLLMGEHDRQAMQVGNDAPIDRFVEGKQSRLVREELTHGGCKWDYDCGTSASRVTTTPSSW
jgi:hypothetical protein